MNFLQNLGFGKRPGAAPAQWGTRDPMDYGAMPASTQYGMPDDYGNITTFGDAGPPGAVVAGEPAGKKNKLKKFGGRYKEGLAALQASGLFDQPEIKHHQFNRGLLQV